MEKAILVDIEKCLACGACRVACAQAHSRGGDLATSLFSGDRIVPRITLKVFGNHTVPVMCQHCQNPPCIKACPSAAIERLGDKGPVVIIEERCSGCDACIEACPFGTIKKIAGMPAPLKCDLCGGTAEQDQEPACAAACPTGAIRFTVIDESGRKMRAVYMKKCRNIQKSQNNSTVQSNQKERDHV